MDQQDIRFELTNNRCQLIALHRLAAKAAPVSEPAEHRDRARERQSRIGRHLCRPSSVLLQADERLTLGRDLLAEILILPRHERDAVPRIAQTPAHREACVKLARHAARNVNDMAQRRHLLLPDDGTGERYKLAFSKLRQTNNASHSIQSNMRKIPFIMPRARRLRRHQV